VATSTTFAPGQLSASASFSGPPRAVTETSRDSAQSLPLGVSSSWGAGAWETSTARGGSTDTEKAKPAVPVSDSSSSVTAESAETERLPSTALSVRPAPTRDDVPRIVDLAPASPPLTERSEWSRAAAAEERRWLLRPGEEGRTAADAPAWSVDGGESDDEETRRILRKYLA